MTAARRGVAARLGIAALNLIAPGLGLLRIGAGRRALQWIPVVPALLLFIAGFYAVVPRLTFGLWLGLSLMVLVAGLVLLVASIALSWRGSRFRQEAPAWWSRWYVIVLVGAACLLLLEGARKLRELSYKAYYLPAESMSPTLVRNDRFVAAMGLPDDLGRGDIVILKVRDSAYVKRVAALAGDRIAMRGGIVILNGRPVPQRFVGRDGAARRLAERFPGEPSEHRVYDLGDERFDHMSERVVPSGHIFVLGDNRDKSADSRVPRAEMGVEMVPITDVLGRAAFRTWGPSGKTGESLTR